jgi:hypothetical protein
MSIAENIRTLARQGLSVADIARQLGIRYQHAYKVLRDGGLLPGTRSTVATEVEMPSRAPFPAKPPLPVEELVAGGFAFSGRWILSDAGELKLDGSLVKDAGVYAFAVEGVVIYVGVSTKSLADRLKLYAKPGSSQSTNLRLNGIIKDELHTFPFIEIYTATPPDSEWNGLPVSGTSGLEQGLIRKYALPWNKLNAS